MTQLTLSYSLSLPSPELLLSTPSFPPSAEFSYPIPTTSPRAQLEALELALGDARDWLNESLTEWKGALKGVEKEVKRSKGEEEGEDGEEE